MTMIPHDQAAAKRQIRRVVAALRGVTSPHPPRSGALPRWGRMGERTGGS